jgi:hypothetical protein
LVLAKVCYSTDQGEDRAEDWVPTAGMTYYFIFDPIFLLGKSEGGECGLLELVIWGSGEVQPKIRP